MKSQSFRSLLDNHELHPGLDISVWKETPHGFDCDLCRREGDLLKSIGWMSCHISEGSPTVSMTVILQTPIGEGFDMELLVKNLLDLCSLPSDTTYWCRLNLIGDDSSTKFFTRFSNENEMPPFM